MGVWRKEGGEWRGRGRGRGRGGVRGKIWRGMDESVAA